MASARDVAERGRLASAAGVLAVMAIGAVFCDARARSTGMMAGSTPFHVMIGEADTPFQYRLLVPKTLYVIVTIFPGLVSHMRTLLGLAEWLFFVGTFACVGRLSARLGAGTTAARARVVLALLVAPFAYLVLPPFRPFYNASDTPSLFFFLASTLALIAERRWAFFVLFLLGTANRETIFVVWLAALLAAVRSGALRREGPVLLASFVGFVGLKAALAVAYSGNGGAGLVQLRFANGDHGLRALWNLRALSGWPMAAWFAALVVLPLGVALGLRRNLAHPLLRALVDVAVPTVAGLLVVGNADEFRMFADVMTLVLFAVATAP